MAQVVVEKLDRRGDAELGAQHLRNGLPALAGQRRLELVVGAAGGPHVAGDRRRGGAEFQKGVAEVVLLVPEVIGQRLRFRAPEQLGGGDAHMVDVAGGDARDAHAFGDAEARKAHAHLAAPLVMLSVMASTIMQTSSGYGGYRNRAGRPYPALAVGHPARGRRAGP